MANCENLVGVTTEQIIESIEKILEAEKHYERLRALAPDEKQAKVIDRLIADQREAYRTVSKLYASITCNQLIIPPLALPIFKTYLEGIKLAMFQELDENGRIILLYSSTTVLEIQEAMIAILFKTYMHTTYLNYLLTINMCN